MDYSAFRHTRHDFTVPYLYSDGLVTIEADRVYPDKPAWEQPAYGQRFYPSLAKPLMLSVYADSVLVGYI